VNVSTLFAPLGHAELEEVAGWFRTGDGRLGRASDEQLAESLAELTHARGARGVAAVRVGAELVAVAAWRRRNDRAELEGLVVAPGHRGRGIGSAALDAVLGHLRARGVPRVRATVDSEAVDEVWFYLEHGFVPVGAGWRRIWPCQLRCLALELERAP
jgi:ribosomal protein S18 acetylase RimI-like enzyme